jgi:hypothetical protein
MMLKEMRQPIRMIPGQQKLVVELNESFVQVCEQEWVFDDAAIDTEV